MALETESANALFKVVVSDDRLYSIWPAHKQNALGWNEAGKQGTRVECLAFINQIWTDMRPGGVRAASA